MDDYKESRKFRRMHGKESYKPTQKKKTIVTPKKYPQLHKLDMLDHYIRVCQSNAKLCEAGDFCGKELGGQLKPTSKSKSKSPAKKDDKTRLLTLDELCADNKAIKFEAQKKKSKGLSQE